MSEPWREPGVELWRDVFIIINEQNGACEKKREEQKERQQTESNSDAGAPDLLIE